MIVLYSFFHFEKKKLKKSTLDVGCTSEIFVEYLP